MKRFSDTKLDDKIMMKFPKTAFSDDDRILNFDDLKTRYKSMLIKHLNFWKVASDKFIVFYRLDLSGCPSVKMSVKINQDLKVQFFPENGFISELKGFLGSERLLTHWLQLKNILNYLESNKKLNTSEYIDLCMKKAIKNLNDCLILMDAETCDSFPTEQKIRFLINQLLLLNHKEYCVQTIHFAYSIYLKSSTCYKEIRELGFLTLPKVKSLLKYISSDSQDETSDNDYDRLLNCVGFDSLGEKSDNDSDQGR